MGERKQDNADAALIVRLYETLQRIGQGYQTSDQLRRDSEKDWGLSYGEALEYAYDNVRHEASRAIKGLRIGKYRAAIQRAEGQ